MGELSDIRKGLKNLLSALNDYFSYGSSHRWKLDEQLEKHEFNIFEPIGIIDIISLFCNRYKVKVMFDRHGNIQIRREIK